MSPKITLMSKVIITAQNKKMLRKKHHKLVMHTVTTSLLTSLGWVSRTVCPLPAKQTSCVFKQLWHK